MAEEKLFDRTRDLMKQISTQRKIIFTAVSVAVVALIVILAVMQPWKFNEGTKRMAVASDNDVCTQIGADILYRGGSAVDSAIAILLCLGAVQPQSNGIGGGGFMLIHTRTEDKVINFRERAPAAASDAMFVEKLEDARKYGPLASGVPGSIRGHWTAHQQYGRLNWESLFKPSIKILREGISVTAHMENALKSKKKWLLKDRNLKDIFFGSDSEDSYKRLGENFTNPRLADAYVRISEEGPGAFYEGAVARNIVKASGEQGGGIMTMEDLALYNVSEDEPVRFTYRGQSIISAPPPASGHVIALALQLLDQFSISKFSPVKAWNYIIEAMRFGYAMRSETGDIEFSTKTKNIFQNIRNYSYANNILKSELKESLTGFISPYSFTNRYSHDLMHGNRDGTHTTHVSVLGRDGEAVSCTSTVNLYFGSCVMTDDGIVMNNQMDDFSVPNTTAHGYGPSPENFIVPGKRPMSSSSPSIVLNDKNEATFVTGAAGGLRIISGTLLSLVNALDWKMSLKDNLEAARIHDDLTGETWLENLAEIGDEQHKLFSAIKNLGYNMSWANKYMNVVTSVSRLHEETEALGDPRKNGTGRVVSYEV